MTVSKEKNAVQRVIQEMTSNRVGQNCAITASAVGREEVLQQQHGALVTWEDGNKIKKMSGKVMSMQRRSDSVALDTNSVRNSDRLESLHMTYRSYCFDVNSYGCSQLAI